MTARLDPGWRVRLGETVHLMPDLARVQLFVSGSGLRVEGMPPSVATPAAVLAGLSRG